jgi:hypothetical protein
MRRLAPVVALAALLAAAAPAPGHYPSRGEKCRKVVFTPQSDDVATNIAKREMSCRTARRIVTIVRRKGDRTPLGFDCRFRSHDPDTGLAHLDAVCTNTGHRRVSWVQY